MAVVEEHADFEQSERPAKLRKIHNAQFSSDAGAGNELDSSSESKPAEQSKTSEPNDSESKQQDSVKNNEDAVSQPVASDAPPMSKSALKKMRKKAEWAAKKPGWKAHQKEKRVARKERQRAEKEILKETNPAALEPVKKPKAVQLPISFIIDCDFDSFMSEKERSSLASQITRCYSDNGKSRHRAHLAICSFGGLLRERFDTVLVAYKAWKGVRWFDEDFVATAEKAKEWMVSANGSVFTGAFDKYAELDDAAKAALKEQGEVVYLTSDADNDLTELKPYSTYIIGGVVDKNREKGICQKRATQRGLKTARLPIGEFMNMTSRKVLATNHVNEIMLRWLECRDWAVAFDQVIPKRKGGTLKTVDAEGDDNQEDAEDENNDDVVDEVESTSEQNGGNLAKGADTAERPDAEPVISGLSNDQTTLVEEPS